ncbi:pentatricopeptide repeat-containing protein At1g07590, mitochondrial isoform X2 [Cryptomeria japonica]|uniref:pentatricopeptide repeat-containing protein At1g07590, mitochondrial isoform X2 n=1 Tax=Cryptomeria japonica TaxID=3369 RepID=UPI0027DA6B39|nr:pentatricopeptide repeat-containing protein At1g07590, mitochondrial isoform X2 [Cryptomeria japonica]
MLAMKVAEWVVRERPYKLKEIDYSYLLEFTAKVHGMDRAEKLFMHIPSEFQNELLYNNLVMACLERRLIGKTLQYMKKMREQSLPIAPMIYNKLILLNESLGHKKSIHSILVQMKADGVAPNTRTYNILLKIKSRDYDIEGIQNVFDKMNQGNVSPNEITYCILANAYAIARLYAAAESFVEAAEKTKTGTNWSTLDILMSLYGSLRKEDDLKRTWELVKKLPNIRRKSYILAVEAFGKIGCIDKAEEIWQELMLKGEKSTEHYNAIISVYGRHGLIQKAAHIFREMRASSYKPNAITFHHLILCCLKADLVDEGLKSISMAENYPVNNRVQLSTPWLETTLLIVETFANKGNVEFAEKFFTDITKSKYCRYTFVYNTLLKAYVKANLCPHDFLRRMILSGARPDSESYTLVKLLEQLNTGTVQHL